MIKLIPGRKGSGKTKVMIDMINSAVKTTTGDLVCIEKSAKLTYDISYKVRLVETLRFNIDGYSDFYGFIAGMLAGNYDIKEIYVDSILKIGGDNIDELAVMIEKLEKLTGEDTKLVFTIAKDKSELPDSLQKYLV